MVKKTTARFYIAYILLNNAREEMFHFFNNTVGVYENCILEVSCEGHCRSEVAVNEGFGIEVVKALFNNTADDFGADGESTGCFVYDEKSACFLDRVENCFKIKGNKGAKVDKLN